ncbi:uncharacterized membrane protein YuzA (DUF378 family) [Flavobacterium sp. CG_23.5]|uniref:hypothetical protein n=1 Tax=unclassified Flavobacterium TaxID=196869 RepID=UPI0018C9DD3C|nr:MULTISPECIES: hypothetical protein [unclassified Flavobacterium]MBG6109395.1 uncharacterized membrane protein YuzA (DUF378 family) [Flavobacterium sp. CG_9.10]MBP2283358.1 uncharacterized membrane protein YuzA (DUF378 family) [Flavobacterium sp. CG_23.5]
MTFLKYIPYFYLIFAIIFIYDGVTKLNDPAATPYLSFGIAGVAIFMFFFRMKFAKKFEDRNKKS